MQIGNSQTECMTGQPPRSMLPRFPTTIEWMEQVGVVLYVSEVRGIPQKGV
jgi:hypothetical protein